ncbi:MAG: MurR/RpiR family transcriptional regulator [Firmicutes bacterium]|nr:MurR/RpiR family transcriptional regulator [Bacillota bacterium]
MRAFDTNPILLVHSAMSGLTKAEQKVAQIVLQDPEFVMFASVTDVAERAQVGETTVIRVCRKLGYRGYQEFKLAIAQHLAEPTPESGGPIETSDSLATVLQKIAYYNTQTLQDTAKLLRTEQVEEAARLVLGAQHVYVFGVGSSGITALDLQYRLMRIGIHANCEADAHKIAMLCALAKAEDVVIGISSSGSTKDLIDALTIAKRNGAPILCVTNHVRSPITQLARIALLTAAREAPLQGGAVGTKIAQMHVLDALVSTMALLDQDKAMHAIEKTAEAVVDKLL